MSESEFDMYENQRIQMEKKSKTELESSLAAARAESEALRKRLAALQADCERYREALSTASSLISSEYCSHRAPCGGTPQCYADFIYKALSHGEAVNAPKDELTDIIKEDRELAQALNGESPMEARELREDLDREIERLTVALDHLLAHCKESECGECGKIICPDKDELHFHHDGCPSEYQRDCEWERGVRNRALEEAISLAEQEKVSGGTGTEEDKAYNHGIEDVLTGLRSLRKRSENPFKGQGEIPK